MSASAKPHNPALINVVPLCGCQDTSRKAVSSFFQCSGNSFASVNLAIHGVRKTYIINILSSKTRKHFKCPVRSQLLKDYQFFLFGKLIRPVLNNPSLMNMVLLIATLQAFILLHTIQCSVDVYLLVHYLKYMETSHNFFV